MLTYELTEEKRYLFGYFFPLIVNAPPSRSLELLISSVIEDRKVILCRSPRHLRIRRVFILIFLLFLFFFFFFCLDCRLFSARSFPFSPLFPPLFLAREKSWVGGTPRREDRSLGEVILFTRSWASLLIEDSTLVIFARFEREEEGCARTVDCALWFRSGEDDCVWRSVDDDRIDFVQRLDGKVAYSKWSILFLIHFFNLSKIVAISFFLSERKKSQVPLMSLENFLNLFFQVINRIKMKIR